MEPNKNSGLIPIIKLIFCLVVTPLLFNLGDAIYHVANNTTAISQMHQGINQNYYITEIARFLQNNCTMLVIVIWVVVWFKELFNALVYILKEIKK